MNFILAVVLLLTSISGFAQQTPKDLLAIFRKDYLPTITKRHELFLLEYNKARLIDYITLYKHNTEKINSITARYETLINDWRPMVKSGLNHSSDLPLLASMKQEAGNLRRELEEATLVIASITESLPNACNPDEIISWMNEKFLPTRIYQVPHYQFTGDGADHNLNLTFQMNYSTSFGGNSSSSGHAGNNQTGMAQIGDGSKEATAFAAAGMIAGIAIGSLVGPAGSAAGAKIGGYIGLAVGTAVGSILSSAKKMKEANKTYNELKNTFHDINKTLEAAHQELDKDHHEMVQRLCRTVFDMNAKLVFPETNKRAKAVLTMINAETLSMEREWADIKNFHKERLQNHQMFLDLVVEGYQLNFEKKLETLEEDHYTLNEKLKKEYVTKIVPVLKKSDAEELIDLQILGDAQYNHPDYQNYAWKAINEKINEKLGIK